MNDCSCVAALGITLAEATIVSEMYRHELNDPRMYTTSVTAFSTGVAFEFLQ